MVWKKLVYLLGQVEFLLGALHRVETDRPVGSTLTLPRGLHDLRGRLGPLRVSHGVGERACVVWAGGKEGVSGDISEIRVVGLSVGSRSFRGSRS